MARQQMDDEYLATFLSESNRQRVRPTPRSTNADTPVSVRAVSDDRDQGRSPSAWCADHVV